MLRVAPPGALRLRQAIPGLVETSFAGAEANVCASLAMLGTPARFSTALPKNPLTDSLSSILRGLGIDVGSILWRSEGRLGAYFVETGANQRGSAVVYDRDGSAVSLAAPAEYDFGSALAGVDWLHVTGITPSLSENAFLSTLDLVRHARSQGALVSCDLNFRAKLWRWRPGTPARSLASDCMAQILPEVQLLIANEEDAADVLGIHAAGSDTGRGIIDANSYEQVARRVAQRFSNLRYVAITLRESISADYNRWGGLLLDAGAGLAHLAPRDSTGTYRPYDIRDIVDRVGAGDAFAAGLIHALHTQSASPPEALGFAVAASCLKHSIRGDFNYAAAEEISRLVAGVAGGRVQR